MAQIHSPHPISGSLGDLTFSRQNGKTIARLKPGISRQKFLTHPRLQRSRENAQAFGGASKLACAIYSAATFKRKKMATPYAHNELIARVHRAVKRNRRVVESIGFLDIGREMQGLDFSRERGISDRLKTKAIGPVHCPDTLKISGIQEAANAAQGRGRGRMECRLQLIHVPFPEVLRTDADGWTFAAGTKPCPDFSPLTDWIPVEILPSDGLRLSLILPRIDKPNDASHTPPDPSGSAFHSQVPTMIFLAMEWREVNETDTVATKLPEKTVLRQVAIQMDEETAKALAAQPIPKSKQVEEIRQDWRESPAAFLQSALKGIEVPPPIQNQHPPTTTTP